MTDEARDRRPGEAPGAAGRRPDVGSGAAPRRPSKPKAGWVFGGALGAFFAALALLAFQVRAGQDPALGLAQPAAQVQTKPRRVLVRKVIERVVVHHPPTSSGAAPAATGTSAPRATSSAPAPAPAPVAAPAPAPAPMTTQSS